MRIFGAILALSLAAWGLAAQPTVPVLPAVTAQQQSAFAQWRDGFRGRALREGIPAAVFDAAFHGRSYNPEVVYHDQNQAEFTRAIWDYLDRAVSEARVGNGRRLARRHTHTLRLIEARFGVEPPVVLAIWGMESNYGAMRGDIPVVEALGTLAVQGRRRTWAERELLSALRILANGDIAPSRFTGSWAGAMGHTQFMPSSYLAYARDLRGDGHRDVWADDPQDALASAANYLSAHGWQHGAPVAQEVRLPSGFDFHLIDGETRHDVTFWQSRGVQPVSGTLAPGAAVALWAPAGARGPIFAVYPNFRVIRRYNNAASYALAVGLLAGRIDGAGPLLADWPRDERPLTAAEIHELQTLLDALGHSSGGADGRMGARTRAAVRAYQTQHGLLADGEPSLDLLNQLRQAAG